MIIIIIKICSVTFIRMEINNMYIYIYILLTAVLNYVFQILFKKIYYKNYFSPVFYLIFFLMVIGQPSLRMYPVPVQCVLGPYSFETSIDA